MNLYFKRVAFFIGNHTRRVCIGRKADLDAVLSRFEKGSCGPIFVINDSTMHVYMILDESQHFDQVTLLGVAGAGSSLRFLYGILIIIPRGHNQRAQQ